MNYNKSIPTLSVIADCLGVLLISKMILAESTVTVRKIGADTTVQSPVPATLMPAELSRAQANPPAAVPLWFKVIIAINIVILMFRTQSLEWELLLLNRAFDPSWPY